MVKQYTLADLDAFGLSVTGPVREENQDSILLPGPRASQFPGSLYAVADGMGGYSHGELASSLAIQHMLQTVRDGDTITSPVKTLQRGLETANFEIYKTAQQLGAGRMGTTLTAAYIAGNQLYMLHVGDSRAYLMRGDKLSCITNDHTMVGDLVRSRLITPEQLRVHAQRSVLTRSVGLALFVQPDINIHKLQIGDKLILCSDGLWSVMEDAEIGQIAGSSASSQGLAEELVELALSRGTDDNCSAVAIQLRGFTYQTYEEPDTKQRKWFNFFKK